MLEGAYAAAAGRAAVEVQTFIDSAD
jgi:hypothetical protein